MVEKNNHHFVPQFYLKKFSNNNKSVGMYLFRDNKYIVHGSIKDNAYRKHLYGEDTEIEDALATYEGKWQSIISNIIQTKSINMSEEDYYLLLSFILVSEARTAMVADHNNKEINVLADIACKMKHNKNNPIDIEYEIPNLVPMQIAIEATPILLDLDAVLIINESNRGFITSDNPVVRYNQFFIHRNYFLNHGLGHMGIQIFLPLNPEICLCIYDSVMYSNVTDSVIKIKSGSQINELNKLFLQNAYETIFFNNSMKESFIKSLAKYRTNKDKTDVPVLGGKNGFLIASCHPSVKERIKLDFFKINPGLINCTLPNHMGGPQRPYAEEFSKLKKAEKGK